MSAKTKKPPAKPATAKVNLSELSRLHGVSRETLRAWRDSGVDLTNSKAIAEKLASMRDTTSETITSARLKKLNLESDRLRLQVDSERGKLVDAGLVYSDARSIGSQVRQRLTKAATNDLPPLLAGRSASEIKTLLAKYFRDLCVELSHTQHPITTNLKS